MKRIKDMVAEANEVVRHAPATEMMALHGKDDVMFVDLRDPRELEREGMIPGAFHCPRGMLEFWIDHITDGFSGWKASGGPVGEKPVKKS